MGHKNVIQQLHQTISNQSTCIVCLFEGPQCYPESVGLLRRLPRSKASKWTSGAVLVDLIDYLTALAGDGVQVRLFDV